MGFFENVFNWLHATKPSELEKEAQILDIKKEYQESINDSIKNKYSKFFFIAVLTFISYDRFIKK